MAGLMTGDPRRIQVKLMKVAVLGILKKGQMRMVVVGISPGRKLKRIPIATKCLFVECATLFLRMDRIANGDWTKKLQLHYFFSASFLPLPSIAAIFTLIVVQSDKTCKDEKEVLLGASGYLLPFAYCFPFSSPRLAT
ncbi:hypothetical protein HAX54_049156 [Datura stramonium]|uniref:Uncharacterized protein n=1 Tax=Datura stramonium TaxID=4076 RepID=A0ABS8WP62_DATST|nr:hypothetical protein [Datura stramonium]